MSIKKMKVVFMYMAEICVYLFGSVYDTLVHILQVEHQ